MSMDLDGQDVNGRAVAHCLRRVQSDPAAAATALLRRRDDAAQAEAQARDRLAWHTGGQPPLAGLVLGVKACFDVRGWITHAGSRVLAEAPAAREDAALVRALRQAGAILLAQNNMTEFAYGALGLNGAFGTPLSPLATDVPRVAGGSTSGGALAVAKGMVSIALGSDTSGSARIPAAFCGVAGFKPSKGRYDDGGMMYLSPSFDVPGIIAADAAGCLLVDKALAPFEPVDAVQTWDPATPLAGTRFVVPAGVDAELEPEVQRGFEDGLASLRRAGAVLRTLPMPSLRLAGAVARDGGIIAAEAYALHAERLQHEAGLYDPRVGPRMLLGAKVAAHAYVAAQRRLLALRAQYDEELAGADAVLTPTVPMLPPPVASLDDSDVYLRENARAFSLTEFANRLDLPSISVPVARAAHQPIGLLATGRRGGDRTLLELACRIGSVLDAS
ncbi:amidase [Achromobacter pestifer]